MMLSWSTAGLAAGALILFYAWMKHRYAYWARRGVKFIKPLPLIGNMLTMITRSESFVFTVQKQYYEFKPHKFGGIFAYLTPTLIVTDPDLLKAITVKNFDHFSDRRSVANNKTDPLVKKALVSLKGHEWREMRNLLSPAFTTSKLRAMFPLISRCGEQFAHFFLARKDAKMSPLELKSTFTRFSNDVIATVAFGVECNAVNNPEEEFYIFGQKIMDFRGIRLLIAIGYSIVPKLMELCNISILPRKVTSFFRNIIHKTKQFREVNNVTRPDMVQLLMAAQKGGITRSNDDENDVGTIGESEDAAEFHRKHLAPERMSSKVLTDDDIAAQALVFFIAGFETVSTLMAFISHELAVNQDIQDRMREEIDSTMMENNGTLTYESVQNMKYLDMAISETLRKYPPAAFSDRVCTKEFKVSGTDVVIEKDTQLLLPIYSLHHDPEYFSDPDTFNPERFSDENKLKIKPYTYIPFGSGPHNCIGMRLALLETKICIIHLLATCELRVCSKTEIPLQLSTKTFQMTTDAGFWLLCVPRDNPSINVGE